MNDCQNPQKTVNKIVAFVLRTPLFDKLEDGFITVLRDQRYKTIKEKVTYFKASFLVRSFLPEIERCANRLKNKVYISKNVKSMLYEYFCNMYSKFLSNHLTV